MFAFRAPKLTPYRWRLRDLRRAGLTRWVLLTGLLFMLGLQSAMAGYVCTMPDGSMAPTMAMGTAAADRAMADTCPQMQHTTADRALCAKHCNTDASAPTVAHAPTVPPSLFMALPPVVPAAIALISPATVHHRQSDRLRSPPPPPSLLFCSLLI